MTTVSELTQTAATPTAATRLAANLDTFLTLLTTQLRHQDPLEPLDTEKFTSQLVQFSAVEQSIETNSLLSSLLALQSAGAMSGMLSMIGREATLATDRAHHAGEGARWTYTLSAPAAGTSLSVVDRLGRTVVSFEGATAAGVHEFTWDGRLADGTLATEGVYRLVAIARDGKGDALTANVSTTHAIAAVSFAGGAASLETAVGVFDPALILRVSAAQ